MRDEGWGAVRKRDRPGVSINFFFFFLVPSGESGG